MSQLASRVNRVSSNNEADQPDRDQKIRRQGEKAENFGEDEEHSALLSNASCYAVYERDFRHAA